MVATSGRSGDGAEESAPVPVGGAAPDAEPLSGFERVFEALDPHRAAVADGDGLSGVVLGGGEEQVGVGVAAGAEDHPGTFVGDGGGENGEGFGEVDHGDHLREVGGLATPLIHTDDRGTDSVPGPVSLHAIRYTCGPARSPPERPEEAALLYFAYTRRIDPHRLAEVAPGAEFQFIAHLPEWGLAFPVADDEWGGGLPSAVPEAGSTVWGAVFTVPDGDVAPLDEAEAMEHRRRQVVEAMDRTGRRHQVEVHLYGGNGAGGHAPSSDYVKIMLEGSRHWNLPAGWIAGLEEHLHSS